MNVMVSGPKMIGSSSAANGLSTYGGMSSVERTLRCIMTRLVDLVFPKLMFIAVFQFSKQKVLCATGAWSMLNGNSSISNSNGRTSLLRCLVFGRLHSARVWLC